jgi:3-oxoacyl-[acyl-carrier-protein] synthase III
MSATAIVHGPCFELGRTRDIAELRGVLDEGRVDALLADGMRHYCVSSQSEAELGISSLKRSLDTARIAPSDLDLIIYCCTRFGQGQHRAEFNARCAEGGFAAVPIVGITALGCAAIAPAIRIAAALIDTDQARHIAVVTSDREPDPGERLTQLGAAILSDGAASLIVSRLAGSGYLVLGSAQTADQRLREMHKSAQVPRLLARSARKMRDVVADALRAARLEPDRIQRVVMTNLKRSANHFVLSQANLSPALLFEGSLEQVAHVFSGDPVINLAESDKQHGRRGDAECTLLLSLSPYSWGAVVLRPVG